MVVDADMSLVFNFAKQYRLNYEACSETMVLYIKQS